MVTHDERMLPYCDKILKIVDGKIETTSNHEGKII